MNFSPQRKKHEGKDINKNSYTECYPPQKEKRYKLEVTSSDNPQIKGQPICKAFLI